MATRPTDVYDPVASVAPQTGMPEDYLNVKASPESFGGQVGGALEKAGDTFSTLGEKVVDTAIQFQQITNQAVADKNTTDYATLVSNAENEFRKKQGEDARLGLPIFQKTILDARDQIAAAIQSPMARQAFLHDSLNFSDRAIYAAGGHAADEVTKEALVTFKGKLKAITDFSVLNYNDPQQTSKGIQDLVDSVTNYDMHVAGITDPQTVHGDVTAAVSELVSGIILRQKDQGVTLHDQMYSLKKAESMYQSFMSSTIPGSPGVPYLDREHQNQIGQTLQNRDYWLQARIDSANEKAENHANAIITRTFNNNQAVLDDGHVLPDSAFAPAYAAARVIQDPTQRQNVLDMLDVQRTESHFAGEMSFKTPTQLMNERDTLVAQRDQAIGTPNYTKLSMSVRKFDEASTKRQTILSKDSAGYFVENNPDITTLYKAVFEDPSGKPNMSQFGAYAAAIEAEQKTAGIPDHAQRLLPQPLAQTYAQQIQQNPSNSPVVVKQLAKQYGSYWPSVWKDIAGIGGLPPAYQFVGTMQSSTDQETLARALAETGVNKEGKLGPLLRDQLQDIDRNAIDDRATGHTLVYRTSLTAQENGSAKDSDAALEATKLLAYGNMLYHGDNATQATDKATKAIIGDTEFMPGGGARIPADKSATIFRNSNIILGRRTIDNTYIPPEYHQPGRSPDEYIESIQNRPAFVNSADGTSLLIKDLGGRYVKDTKGNNIRIPFNLPELYMEEQHLEGSSVPGMLFNRRQ